MSGEHFHHDVGAALAALAVDIVAAQASADEAVAATRDVNAFLAMFDERMTALETRMTALEPEPELPPPPPPPPPSVRQPVMLWVGEKNFGRFFDATSYVTLDQLRTVASQVVIQMGRVLSNPAIPSAANVATWRDAVDAGFEVYPGSYVIAGEAAAQPFKPLDDDAGWQQVYDRTTVFAAKALAAGCSGLALDLEPYDRAPTTMWNAKTALGGGARAAMYDRALGLAPIYAAAGPLMVYTSSNASWPGSYYDEVQINAGRVDVYKTNLMPDFIDGLIFGGVQIVHVDATFHWGPQLPNAWFTAHGYDMTQMSRWEAGARETVKRVAARFPQAKGSVMLWPDNQEKTPEWFPPAEMAEAFEAATRVCKAPVVLYQHTITTADTADGALWPPMLNAIAAQLVTP